MQPDDRFEIVVFQWLSSALTRVDDVRWEAFQCGRLPLCAASESGSESGSKTHVKLLLLSLRGAVCEHIDPLTLRVDANGYLCRLDMTMDPLPASRAVHDARSRFVRRYLQHAGQWKPSNETIRRALELVHADPLSMPGTCLTS